MRQVGLLEHYRRQSWPRKNRCTEPMGNKKPEGTMKLKLDHFTSVFLLFGAGVLLSITSFIIELLIFRVNNIINSY